MRLAGIAPIALAAAGCSTFVTDSGRPVELPKETAALAIAAHDVPGACFTADPEGIPSNIVGGPNPIGKPKEVICGGQIAFTPDGAGVIIANIFGIRRIDLGSGAVVWTRRQPEEGAIRAQNSFGWSTDGQWLVVEDLYGEAESHCRERAGNRQTCIDSLRRHLIAIDAATGRPVSPAPDAIVEAAARDDAFDPGWGLSGGLIGIAGAQRLQELSTGADVELTRPEGETTILPMIMKSRQPETFGKAWLGPTDIDPASQRGIWLRMVASEPGEETCGKAAPGRVEVAVYGPAGRAWSQIVTCAPLHEEIVASYSHDRKLVALFSGLKLHQVFDAETGAAVSGVRAIFSNGRTMFEGSRRDWMSVPAGADWEGQLCTPSASGRVLLDTGKNTPNRSVVVADGGTGAILRRYALGADWDNDNRHISTAISADGRLIAVLDTTGRLTILPVG